MKTGPGFRHKLRAIVTPATAFLLLAAVIGFASAAHADLNAIQAVSAAPEAGGKTVVRITLKAPLTAAPAGFTVNNPPRIAFDFPNTANALGSNSEEIGEAAVRSVNAIQVGTRTRLVLNLARALHYDAQVHGNTLLVTLHTTGSVAANNGTGALSHFAQVEPGMQHHSLSNIDFRRGRNGAGRVIVDLSDNKVGIDLKQQGKKIIVNFMDTTLPPNLARRLDVTDFATPVQTVTARQEGRNTQLVIEPRGNWEQSAYQTDNRFILEVKPVIPNPNALVQGSGPGYHGDKLSLNFQNVDVRSVLQVIADFTGLNIITSDSVHGNLTLRLKDVPWDQALDIILQAKGLDMRKNGNVIWIAPRDELATKEKLKLEAQQQIAELEPLHTESFQLNYQKADVFQKMLTSGKQRILSKRGSAVVDARTNTVFVQDTLPHLEQVRQLLQKIDVPVRQVMIEARIVEANDNFARNLGVRLGTTDLSLVNGTGTPGVGVGAGNRAMFGGSLDSTGVQTGQTPNTSTSFDPDSFNVNLPAANINSVPAGVFSLMLFNSSLTRFLNLEISALQADGKGKIISSPRVVTADQVEATIEQGTEIPYQQGTSSGATSVTFKKATLSLKVKPQITPDDNIIMDLDVHKDSPGQQTLEGPAIDTKQITTQVLVENGGTVVIGGIYEQTQTETTNKVPLLGDIPGVGWLFRNNQKVDNRQELLIFITPKIIKNSLTGM
ncbi:MAG TPA: type IV pilus secretin PilQ [Burkholderiales bacterium]|nr:type IV pilus secretin PilQ [Burkholderiales bacterium]